MTRTAAAASAPDRSPHGDEALLERASVAVAGFMVDVEARRIEGRVAFDRYVREHVVILVVTGRPGRLEVRFDAAVPEPCALHPDQVLLIPAGRRVSGHVEGAGDYRSISLRLDPEFVGRAGGVPAPRLAFRPSLDLGDPMIVHSLRVLAREVERPGPAGGLAIESLVLDVASRIARHHAVRPEALLNGDAVRRIARVKDYIEANLAEHLSLVALAGEAGLSPVHLVRLFKRVTGLSPHQYVVRRRVERAADRLAGEGACIMETALSLGFCSQAHLTAVFRRVYGTTPAAFREVYLRR